MSEQSMLFEPPAPPDPMPKNTGPASVFPGVLLYRGDCIDIMDAMPARCVDACVTDPPYGLGFMGKSWDTFKPETVEKSAASGMRPHPIISANPNLHGRQRAPAVSPSQIDYDRTIEGQRAFQAWTERWARSLYRVLKPGAHVLVCGAPRSAHRMICGLEDAGFEIRDSFAWLFAQGFPKSMNVGKAIDRRSGATREVVGHVGSSDPQVVDRNALDFGGSTGKAKNGLKDGWDITAPATDLARKWDGWGTALKPGHEPISVARKPFEGTVEENIARWGVGALNIDACRLDSTATAEDRAKLARLRQQRYGDEAEAVDPALGRWPANVLFDEQAAALLDDQAGERKSGANPTRRNADKFRKVFGNFKGEAVCQPARGAEQGGASRFYFVAKPSQLERNFGCDDLPQLTAGQMTDLEDGSKGLTPYAGAGRSGGGRNPHPTVKPVALMRYLLRLVVPAGGVVLDPFLGSGTTGMAAVVEDYRFVGIEREEKYLKAADARIRATWAEVHA